MKLPYAHVEFTKSGVVRNPAQLNAALAMLDQVGATDVLVLAHGWNNDIAAAERLFNTLSDQVAARVPAGSPVTLAVIGVLWPSVRWADADQIAGGGVAVGDDESELALAIEQSVDDPALAAQLTALTGRLDTGEGRAEFLALARDLLPPAGSVPTADEDPLPAALRSGEPDEVFDAVRIAAADAGDEPLVGASGAGAGSGSGADAPGAGAGAPGVPPDLLGAGGSGGGAPGVAPDLLADEGVAGAGVFGMSWPALGRQVLNTMTYYTMKARAGDVGAKGVAPMVDRINAAAPQRRVHLAGHSFGARVVSSAAAAITTPIESLTLLQGAFSHYGFTSDFAGTGRNGAFVAALSNGRIPGPVVITHTQNDRAVGLAYAIASRLAGQAGAAVGDKSDLYGGIGANGSLGTGAIEWVLGDVSTDYDFQPGSVYNLLADATIASHSDVTNPAVANALAHAIGVR